MTQHPPLEVLLIDPDDEDVRLFLEALEDEKIATQVHSVTEADEALNYLHQRGEYEDVPQPNLIVLEVELPDMAGSELLEELNEEPNLRTIPVIVLADSGAAEDAVRSYDLGANAHVQKPNDPDEYATAVRSIQKFWLEIAWLPQVEDEDEDEIL